VSSDVRWIVEASGGPARLTLSIAPRATETGHRLLDGVLLSQELSHPEHGEGGMRSGMPPSLRSG